MDKKCVRLLEETSRTFLLPIMRMPGQLQDAVGSAYLCLRAIDEIEDHPDLEPASKTQLLTGIAAIFAETGNPLDLDSIERLVHPHSDRLPEVSLSIGELATLAPDQIRPEICTTTAAMAEAMAGWVERDWNVKNEQDLDQYTFDVAGRVGLLLSEIWEWHEALVCDHDLAVGFGRALQAVNIVRNRNEDRARGADFFPDGWNQARMIGYARDKIELADRYMEGLPPSSVYDFCIIPLELAKATLAAIEQGREKLSRADVMSVVRSLGMA